MAKDEAKKEKKEENKDVNKKVEKLVDEISKLSVMELSTLVNELKDKLGVEATPMAAAPVATQATEGGAEGDANDSSGGAGTVILTGAGESKIAVIKALREINQSLGLKEAKDMTESLPSEVLKDAKPEEAKEAADKLKAAGAQVELK